MGYARRVRDPFPWRRRVAAGLAAAILAAPAIAGEAGRSLSWRLLDVDARLDASGDLHVVERQAMVFTGDWNGGERVFRLDRGQSLRLVGVLRVGPDGVARPLAEGSLDAVDHYRWADRRTLRWRSRARTDPPFQHAEIDYVLEYVLSGALVAQADGTYRLAHDFAFPDRPGPIAEVRARLSLDPAWASGDAALALDVRDLPPGRGAVLVVPLRFTGPGRAPDARAAPRRIVPSGPLAAPWPAALRLPLVAALAAALALAIAAVVRHGRARGFFEPPPDAREIDERWLAEHVLAHPAEVIGAAWDDRVGAPEVSAVLARMAAEGKLASSLAPRFLGLQKVLRLRLLVARETLAGYERRLVDGLFFDGDETDTLRLRRHYRRTGFDPSSRISGEVKRRAAVLAPRERRPRSPWIAALALLAAAAAIAAAGVARGVEPFLPAATTAGGLVLFLVSGVAASGFSRAVARRVALAAVALAPMLAWAAGIGWLAWGGAGATVSTVLAAALVFAGATAFGAGLARTPLAPKAIALRLRLLAARRFFARELASPAPRLRDAWIPYLLALGLDRGLDRWVRVHGPAATGATAASGARAAGGGAAWSGGGGAFSGGGASASWAALGSIASSVPAPGSSGSGGGGASSGGGGGGGW